MIKPTLEELETIERYLLQRLENVRLRISKVKRHPIFPRREPRRPEECRC